MPKNTLKSITYDNGTENTGHIEINRIFRAKSYFSQTYHCFKKNTNGIIRRFFPKDANFDNITYGEIAIYNT